MIEFIKGEKFCRWNGVLMSPEKCIEVFGVDGEIQEITNKLWIYDDVIYSDFKISKILIKLGYVFQASSKADPILTHGYVNYQREQLEEELDGKLIIDKNYIDILDNIKSFSEFYKDYPNFNKEKYDTFYKELDVYLENYRDSYANK